MALDYNNIQEPVRDCINMARYMYVRMASYACNIIVVVGMLSREIVDLDGVGAPMSSIFSAWTLISNKSDHPLALALPIRTQHLICQGHWPSCPSSMDDSHVAFR